MPWSRIRIRLLGDRQAPAGRNLSKWSLGHPSMVTAEVQYGTVVTVCSGRVGVVVLPRSSTLRHTGRSCHHDALLLLLPYGYVQATSACSPSVIQCPPAGRPRACERASAQCHHPLFFYARPITSVHNPRHFPGCY